MNWVVAKSSRACNVFVTAQTTPDKSHSISRNTAFDNVTLYSNNSLVLQIKFLQDMRQWSSIAPRILWERVKLVTLTIVENEDRDEVMRQLENSSNNTV